LLRAAAVVGDGQGWVSAERKVKHCEARALMAEEQLTALNAYMAKATHTYQTEIMRLRKELPKGGKPTLRAT
jgi:hypothetical protein